jgi:hypothetical protein
LETRVRNVGDGQEYHANFLDDTLDNVELVTADNNFLALIQSVEGVEFWLDPGKENVTSDTGGVDTDGTVAHSGDVTFDVNTFLVSGSLITTDTDAGRDEVALVRICLEADEIGAKHSVEDLLST